MNADEIKAFQEAFTRLERAIGGSVVGRGEEIRNLLAAFFAGGHVLIESEPGLGKTLLAKAFSAAVGLQFARVQFTPDLMPADITGTNIFVENANGGRRFEFRKGPVFTQVLLADEITRATPKTQSALLEAMQERRVTVGAQTYQLAEPFFVIATQPPSGSRGTYPLPEAQVDRFLMKITLDYPDDSALREIGRRRIHDDAGAAVSLDEILRMLRLVREVQLTERASVGAARMVLASHPGRAESAELSGRYVRYGASPRAAQALVLAGKVFALLDGRRELSMRDILDAAMPCLRHRILLNFEGTIESVRTERIINEIVESVKCCGE